MNLILDLGNTHVKIAVFEKSEIIKKLAFQDIDSRLITSFLKDFPAIKKAIISSVRDFSPEITDFLKNSLDFVIELDKNTALPLENLYESRESLGYDRIADAVGAAVLHPGKNILVIDSGRAITFDFINEKGQFEGGTISPGVSTRARALNKFTARLPLVEPREEFSFPAKNTEKAINSGILKGVIYEIDGYINELKQKYPDLVTVLTGGNINLFDKKLKNIIFVDSNLNLHGLNRILDYNAQ